MGPEGSLQCSQDPATGPYPEPGESSPQPYFLKIYCNIILPSTPRSTKWFFPSGFPTNILHVFLIFPMRAASSTNLVLLDFTALILFFEEFRL